MAHYNGGGAYDDGYIGDQYGDVSGEGGNSQYGYEQALPAGGDDGADYSTLPDVLQLISLCENASPPSDDWDETEEDADESWEPVREWLRSHNADEVRDAATHRGDSNMTAVHIACRNSPPLDVIDVFLTIADETLQSPDSYGWLPIHYACACAASSEVVKVLAEKYPESKTTVDRRGRTPLHFALGQSNQNPGKLAEPAVIAILANTGAAAYADEHGMLVSLFFSQTSKLEKLQKNLNRLLYFIILQPLHYACAYGATEEALFVLTEKHHDAIWTRDQDNRTPLHFALSNAERKTSPGAVRHLLELDPSLANTHGVGPLPLRTIAEYSLAFRKNHNSNKAEAKENIQKCLEYLLNKNPEPTADFFTALQALPDWLSEKAVVLRSVQELLNLKITQR